MTISRSCLFGFVFLCAQVACEQKTATHAPSVSSRQDAAPVIAPPHEIVPPRVVHERVALDSDANPNAPLEAAVRQAEAQSADVLPSRPSGFTSPRSDQSSPSPSERGRPPKGQSTASDLWDGR